MFSRGIKLYKMHLYFQYYLVYDRIGMLDAQSGVEREDHETINEISRASGSDELASNHPLLGGAVIIS